MAQHKVTIRVPSGDLGNSDVCFDVRVGPQKLGTFQLSKGSVEFIPANAREKTNGKVSGYRVRWQELADMISANSSVRDIKRQ